MIKKYLLWLWIVVLGFLWFSDAKVQDIWLLKYPSTVDQNFSIWFIKWGGVLTDYLWTTKSVVALDTNTIFWWATNWMPYFYSEWVNTIQWFFDRYFSCDALTTIDTLPENCQLWWIIDYSWDLQSIKEIFKGFFSKVKQDDLAYYNYINENYVGGTLRYTEQWLDICWSSEEIWKSLCFRGWTCESSSSYHCNWFLGGWQLTNSQNLSNLSFWNVSNNWIWYAPWQVWYDWWQSEIPDWDLTNVSCPTIQQLINNYNSKWFNSWLCYSSDKIFNWSSFVTVWSQSIFDLFSSKDDYLTALQGYWTYCENSVYNSSVCADYFSWQELRFNIISKLPKDLDVVWWRKQLYTYCNLYNYDPNATTCVSSWVTADVWTEITNQDVVHSLSNWQYTIVSPVTNNTEYNTVFNNWSWYEYSWDIITNIQQLFWKFTSLFRQQTWNSPWILPLWILIPFIIIVLFKLFKR